MPIEVLDNTEGKRLGDSLRAVLDDDAKLSIISAHVSLFAFGELREELECLDSVRVLFNEPTFISDMERLADVPEFDIVRRAQCERERALADTDLELSLRNKLNHALSRGRVHPGSGRRSPCVPCGASTCSSIRRPTSSKALA